MISIGLTSEEIVEDAGLDDDAFATTRPSPQPSAPLLHGSPNMPRLARNNSRSPIGVDPDAVRIGKDVIELVTSGMYVVPTTIYREYVQNAADAIDLARAQGLIEPNERGQVSISIDHEQRSVCIRDNGAGIPASDAVETLLAVGDSHKRGTSARGFRGVGRLSGLAYCKELEFRTKASGDMSWVSVTLDCHALRNRLADNSFDGDLREIISQSTYIWSEKADDPSEHFFEVRMSEVGRHRQDMLLNEKLIGHYLAQVAPVPFSDDFSHGPAIEQALSGIVDRTPIALTIGSEPIARLYRDEIRLPGGPYRLKVDEIEIVQFADVDGEVGAIGWIGHHDYVRSIHPSLGVRGLRARVGDLQVGEAGLFDECFREPRFNAWSMGEIHVLDRRIRPDGRRDNFELNHHAYNLITQVGPVAAQIAKRCRSASVARNSALIIRNTVEQIDQRITEPHPFARGEISKFLASIQRCRRSQKEPMRRRLSRSVLNSIGSRIICTANRRVTNRP